MTTHELKTWPEAFNPILDGIKKFEYRKNDRGFERGDRLLLREWTPEKGYNGRCIWCAVTYILKEGFGLPEGYCVMSINVIAFHTREEPQW